MADIRILPVTDKDQTVVVRTTANATAIAVNDAVEYDTDGIKVKVADASNSGQVVCGIALDASSAASTDIRVVTHGVATVATSSATAGSVLDVHSTAGTLTDDAAASGSGHSSLIALTATSGGTSLVKVNC